MNFLRGAAPPLQKLSGGGVGPGLPCDPPLSTYCTGSYHATF